MTDLNPVSAAEDHLRRLRNLLVDHDAKMTRMRRPMSTADQRLVERARRDLVSAVDRGEQLVRGMKDRAERMQALQANLWRASADIAEQDAVRRATGPGRVEAIDLDTLG